MKESAMRHADTFATRFTAAAAAATALVLTACGQHNDHAATAARPNAAQIKAAVQAAAEEAEQFARAQANAMTDTTRDLNITGKVSAALAQDRELEAAGIEVHTKDGHVELSGSAPSVGARQRAGEIASRVDGVVAVENDLTLSGTV
jgi:hyperosmotically inducible periplasmic protein